MLGAMQLRSTDVGSIDRSTWREFAHWVKDRQKSVRRSGTAQTASTARSAGAPDDPSVTRLVSMLAIEANDEWLVGRSYIRQGSMATLYDMQSDGSLFPI